MLIGEPAEQPIGEAGSLASLGIANSNVPPRDFQGNIFGLPVSGNPKANALLAFGPAEGSSELLSGGEFGFEASPATLRARAGQPGADHPEGPSLPGRQAGGLASRPDRAQPRADG
jgi:hypothetical protein